MIRRSIDNHAVLRSRRLMLLFGALCAAALLLAASAQADPPVTWKLTSISDTTVDPNGHASIDTTTQGSASPAVNEVQRLTVDAGSGSFNLSFAGQSTGELDFDAQAATLQSALEGLSTIGAGNVSVAGGPGGDQLTPYLITFEGALGAQDVAPAEVTPGPTPLGGRLTYKIGLLNDSDANPNFDPGTGGSPIKLNVTLPPGMSGLSADTSSLDGAGGLACPVAPGATVIECEGVPFLSAHSLGTFTITVAVDPGASGVLTTAVDIEGGGAPETAHTVDPVTVTATPAGFGLDAFDLSLSGPGGEAFRQAAGHPGGLVNSLDFNLRTNPSPVVGSNDPVEDVRDVTVDLPPGLIGNPSALGQCTLVELVPGGIIPKPFCPVSSQVGTALVRVGEGILGLVPLYNMVPPPGVPARFAFNVKGTVITLDAHVRSSSDYGISTVAASIPQGVAIAGNDVEFWDVPSAPIHDSVRDCPGVSPRFELGSSCPSDAPPAAFFRMPTSCTTAGEGLPVAGHADSWQHPGAFKEKSIRTHQPLGYPYPEAEGPAGNMHRVWGPEAGVEGCDQVPFEPTIDTTLTTNRADSPTGLAVDIGLPSDCWAAKATVQEAEDSICQSDMKEARVTLPEGVTINASAAGGREACTPAQVGLSTPVGATPAHFNEAPVSCPEAAKIGTVTIETPPLKEPLKGAVYLAQQSQNPFNSLLAMYLVAEGSGVVVKQAGKISLSESGQLTTSFGEVPQVPFSKIHVELSGGPRAALRTPPTCGTYTTQTTMVPWSGNAPAHPSSSVKVSECGAGGFDPKLSAGTENPLAGSFSPFNLRLSREDGSPELGGLTLGLPPGLVASLKDIPYCPDSTLGAISKALGSGAGEINAPACPAASQVGTVTAGAGAGPNPFYANTGKAYWAGPYKGAPVSLAVVVPAVAGPFDLGNVVVRNRFEVNPETAKITAVSDPFPSSLYGIPLDLRDVRLNLNRPNYTLNPTSCDPAAFDGLISSNTGQSAARDVHFQVAGCDRLAFKPKLSLRLHGKTTRGSHPALTATVKMPKGGANLAGAVVALPHSEFLDQGHIGTICTRVQYAAGNGGGQQCPKKSIYGQATAYSPILGYYLKGNVYLRSSTHELPDLVLGLKGPPAQPIQVDAVGRIDSTKGGGIRTSFESVPDVPVSKVILKMQGGGKGLLQNSTNVCQGTHRADARFTAHNNALREAQPELVADCGPKARKGSHKHGPYHH